MSARRRGADAAGFRQGRRARRTPQTGRGRGPARSTRPRPRRSEPRPAAAGEIAPGASRQEPHINDSRSRTRRSCSRTRGDSWQVQLPVRVPRRHRERECRLVLAVERLRAADPRPRARGAGALEQHRLPLEPRLNRDRSDDGRTAGTVAAPLTHPVTAATQSPLLSARPTRSGPSACARRTAPATGPSEFPASENDHVQHTAQRAATACCDATFCHWPDRAELNQSSTTGASAGMSGYRLAVATGSAVSEPLQVRVVPYAAVAGSVARS